MEHITVTAPDVERSELVLPEISTPVASGPATGDMPALKFEHDDGAAGTLEEYRGHYLIVNFWASWCSSCQQQLPALGSLYAESASTSRVTMISLSLDEDVTAWHEALKDHKMAWPQGRLSMDAKSGVSSVPTYWLLDPDGKLLARSADLGEIRQRLKEVDK